MNIKRQPTQLSLLRRVLGLRRPWRGHPDRRVDGTRARQLADGCLQVRWHQQRLDHFAHDRRRDGATWAQRVFTCDKWWSADAETGRRGPIWFYVGNEGDVEVYVNNTGLMWENAEAHGALLVFAEHRYYGQSQPFGPDSWKVDPTYLTTGQALADYAALLWTLKHETPGAEDSPVIVFGGSYGGELATWMRIKYPHLVTGAIAASAPILGFPGVPGFDPSAFWKVVTYDATPEAGSPALCVNNTRLAFKVLTDQVQHPETWTGVARFMRLCEPLKSPDDVMLAAYWAQGAFDAYAMGNYPYPSSYINGDPEHPLPAWPLRKACQHMTQTLHLYQSDLLEALGRAAGLMYNASGTLPCFKLEVDGPAAANTGPWDFQVCTEQMAQEQPYFPARGGLNDMFFDQGEFDPAAIAEHCQDAWGLQPDSLPTPVVEYGGADALTQVSNIVLSNGLLDPWSAFGVMQDVSDTVVAVVIPNGAHHVDLMFSHPADTPDIQEARRVELQHIGRWTQEHGQKRAEARVA